MVAHLFASPFRIFFVSTAAWACLGIGLWLSIVTGAMSWPLGLSLLQWHQHEMLFGFLNAAVAGFLLTAVCAWTNSERLHGLPLFLLWLVWLLGRLLALAGAAVPESVVIAINLAFLPLVALDAGVRIWRARQTRQTVVLVVLALLWLAELGLLLEPGVDFSGAALITTAALMLVIGGRITPAFTRNWLRAHQRNDGGVVSYGWLDTLALLGCVLLLTSLLLDSPTIVGVLAIAAAVVTLIRTLLWRGWLVRDEPLLWTLHLSLLWIPAAFALLAASALLGWPVGGWKHAMGVGAMGSLILTVMARVALGHTGRPLHLPGIVLVAWWLLFASAVVRSASALGWVPWLPGIAIAGGGWVIAFAIYLWRYLPVLTTARPDNRPG